MLIALTNINLRIMLYSRETRKTNPQDEIANRVIDTYILPYFPPVSKHEGGGHIGKQPEAPGDPGETRAFPAGGGPVSWGDAGGGGQVGAGVHSADPREPAVAGIPAGVLHGCPAGPGKRTDPGLA